MTEALYIIINFSSSINKKLQELTRTLEERNHLESETDGLYTVVSLDNGQEALLVNPDLEVRVSNDADIYALDYLFDGAISVTTDEVMKVYLEQNKLELQNAIKNNLGKIMRPWELIELTPWGQPYSETNLMGYRTYEQMIADGFIVESTM